MIKKYFFQNEEYYYIQISVLDTNRKRHQRRIRRDNFNNRIKSLKKAEILKVEKILELKAEVNAELDKLPFCRWHEKFLDTIKYELKKSTIAMYDGDLKKWLSPKINGMVLDQVKKRDIQELIYEDLPSRGASDHTQKRILKSLRRLFEVAKEEGYIHLNPASGIKIKVEKSEKGVLKVHEAQKLLYEAKSNDHRFYYHWALALLTGMRSGEMYSLRWNDIDESTRRIQVAKQWTSKDGYHETKTNKSRIIPISDDLMKLLIELRNLGPFKEILKGRKGEAIEFNDLVLPRLSEWRSGTQAKVLGEFCNLINITKIRFHDLRATFTTHLLSQNVAYPKVMSITGHSKTSTLDEYLRLAGVDTKGVTENLSYSIPHEIESIDGNVLSMFK